MQKLSPMQNASNQASAKKVWKAPTITVARANQSQTQFKQGVFDGSYLTPPNSAPLNS